MAGFDFGLRHGFICFSVSYFPLLVVVFRCVYSARKVRPMFLEAHSLTVNFIADYVRERTTTFEVKEDENRKTF